MKRTYIVYREGDAGTEEHAAVVTCGGMTRDAGLCGVANFLDGAGAVILSVADDQDLKVRLLGEDE